MFNKRWIGVMSAFVCFAVSYGMGRMIFSFPIGNYFLDRSGYTRYFGGAYKFELPESKLGVMEVGRSGESGGAIEKLETWIGKGTVGEVVCQTNYFKEGVLLNLQIGPNGSLARYNNFFDGVQIELRSTRCDEGFIRYIDLDADGDIDIMQDGEGQIAGHGKRRVGNSWQRVEYNEASSEWEIVEGAKIEGSQL